MYKIALYGLLLASWLVFSGCSMMGEAINPYKSSFNCPLGDNGKCINMTDAYKESLQPNKNISGPAGSKQTGKQGAIAQENAYQDSLYKKLAGLLDEPTTPVIAPPKVMRVLFLPYKGTEKELFMYRYVFFVVDDYSWVLGDNMAGEN